MTPEEATDFKQWAEELDIDDSPTVRVEITEHRRTNAIHGLVLMLLLALPGWVAIGFLIWWLVR